jgi:hypothetical protein
MAPQFMMGSASCLNREHRNEAQQTKKLNCTLVSEMSNKQGKRFLFYRSIL